MTPYRAPCIQAVCPVPTSSAERPRIFSSSRNIQAVVRFPTAESVPSTATFRHATSSILPLKKCIFLIGGGFRTSRIFTPRSAAAAEISASSLRNSCNPESIFNPAWMASRTFRRPDSGKRPPSGANPTTKWVAGAPCSRAFKSASERSSVIRIPFQLWSRTSPASRPASPESTTARIRYRAERRTSPWAVFP